MADAGLRDNIEGRNPSELHGPAEAKVAKLKYARPQEDVKSKGFFRLGAGEMIRGSVQVLKPKGGENNLHYHTNVETLWWVIKGRVKFYGNEDVLLGDFGPGEGIITPRYSRYWFENGSDSEAELLQVAASDVAGLKSGRTDAAARPESMKDIIHFKDEQKARA